MTEETKFIANPVSRQGLSLYLDSYEMTPPDVLEKTKSMFFALGTNAFVKYRDQAKQILHIKTKLPQPNFPNVRALQ